MPIFCVTSFVGFRTQSFKAKVEARVKGSVRVTQNIVKKGPTLITFDIKH